MVENGVTLAGVLECPAKHETYWALPGEGAFLNGKRIHDTAPTGFRDRLEVLEIEAVFELDHVPERIIDETLDAWRQRRLRS